MNEYIVTINNKKHEVKVYSNSIIEINGKNISSEITVLSQNAFLLNYGNKIFEISSSKLENDRHGLLINGWYFDTSVRTKLQESINDILKKKGEISNRIEVKAPMPGLILKIKKNVGDFVNKGESLIIFEAMKMENEIKSASDGKIKSIFIKEGDTIEKNFTLLIIE